jgi:hypothetical protein
VSKNKSYNSILFLTTLSVYLGLVLVGASPSVLAQQAALTSKFEIQNEIEFEDDLGKNPEDEGINHYFLTRFDNALNSFVEDLRTLNRRGKYKFNSRSKYKNQEEIIIGSGHTFCSDNIVDATSSYVVSWVSEDFEKLRRNLDIVEGKRYSQLAKFIENPIDQNGYQQCKEFNLEFSLNKTELKVKVSFTQDSFQKSAVTAENLNASLSTKAVNAQKNSTKKFYENTKAKAENQYVSVITRLPRGSLDALVKSKR